MKLLIVTGTFPPRKFGGVTKSSCKLAKMMNKHNHEVTVYTTDTGNDKFSRLKVPTKENYNGIKIHYFRNLSNYLAFKYRIYFPLGMIKEIKKNIKHFDIIAMQEYRSVMCVYIYWFAIKNNIPYIIKAGGSAQKEIGKKGLKNVFDILFGKNLLCDASMVEALTNEEKKQYLQLGVKAENIEIIPNTIRKQDFLELPQKNIFRTKYNIDKNDLLVLSLGRLNKIKGLDLLIEAYSEVLNSFNNSVLIIAGPDDGELSYLKEQVSELNLTDKIIFTGPLYNSEKLSAYVDADIFVIPSRYESFGNTILESWMCETPVIGTTECHLHDVISEGGIVAGIDEKSLQKALILLLSDKEKREKLGKKGKDYVLNNFEEEKVFQIIENKYLRLIINI